MDPPPVVSYYDPGLYSLWDISYEVEISSESVQGEAPEAEEEGHVEEGDPVLTDDIDCKGDIDHEGDHEGDNDQKGNVSHEGGTDHDAHGNHDVDENQERGDGGQEPGQQLAEAAHVAAPTAPVQENLRPRIRRVKFRPDQRLELESIFKDTQYPDLITR